MNTVNIKLYDIARHKLKLSEADAKEFVQAVDEVVKEDIRGYAVEYRSVVKEDMLKLEMALRTEIKETKTDTIKWMVGLFVSFFLAIVGLVFTIVKIIHP